jgi:predicted enzyme related to lactoylglutathione lyase
MPTWVDLASPDVVVSARFYGGLFGWDTATTGPPDLTGGYLTFQLDGKDVAGVGPMADDDEAPTWTTYFAVRNADEAEAIVVGNGGTTLRRPRNRLDAGRFAVFVDPPGAVFGVWQPERHAGAEVAGVPGTMGWHQLASRNVGASKRFYAAVFGWEAEAQPSASTPDSPSPSASYTWFRQGSGNDVAGLVEMDRSWPRGLPSHWMTSFAVDDCDAAAARAVELGGEVSVEPYDLPDVGRMAVLGDPHGAVFGILAPVEARARTERWPSLSGAATTWSVNALRTNRDGAEAIDTADAKAPRPGDASRETAGDVEAATPGGASRPFAGKAGVDVGGGGIDDAHAADADAGAGEVDAGDVLGTEIGSEIDAELDPESVPGTPDELGSVVSRRAR